MSKKILVPGGTGAMGTYLVPEFSKRGYKVDVVSLDDVVSDDENVTYIKADLRNIGYLRELLKNKYDAIVDFMIYSNMIEFTKVCKMMLDSTEHYVFFSSYRVYDEAPVITENSPRLLDSSEDSEFLHFCDIYTNGDYSLYKAAQENFLMCSKYDNWTILRPAITYSKRRFQLTTLEAPLFVPRALDGKTVALPESCLDSQATMSWAGDVGKMISGLIFNPKAYREAFTVSTSEHHTWREIAEIYSELIGLKYIAVSNDEYLKIFDSYIASKYQLIYDRCFNRVIDNSKILEATGMKQSELMPLKEGLRRELSALPKGAISYDEVRNKIIDDIVKRASEKH